MNAAFINDLLSIIKKWISRLKQFPVLLQDKSVIDLIHRLNTSLITISGEMEAKVQTLMTFLQEKALFLIAVSDEKPIACGGFRPFHQKYVKLNACSPGKNIGLGGKILSALEKAAKQFDYKYIYLWKPVKKNDNAVKFYLKNEYKVIENYGIYIGREEAICFSKEIK